jgi:hypothetical protein
MSKRRINLRSWESGGIRGVFSESIVPQETKSNAERNQQPGWQAQGPPVALGAGPDSISLYRFAGSLQEQKDAWN